MVIIAGIDPIGGILADGELATGIGADITLLTGAGVIHITGPDGQVLITTPITIILITTTLIMEVILTMYHTIVVVEILTM